MAAKRFLGKALSGLKDWEQPEIINTDKAPAYAAALAELKTEGKCPETRTSTGQVSEQRRRGRPRQAEAADSAGPRFQDAENGLCDDQGLRGDAGAPQRSGGGLQFTRDIRGEARLVERAFGLGPCALTEAVQLVGEWLEPA